MKKATGVHAAKGMRQGTAIRAKTKVMMFRANYINVLYLFADSFAFSVYKYCDTINIAILLCEINLYCLFIQQLFNKAMKEKAEREERIYKAFRRKQLVIRGCINSVCYFLIFF